MARPEPEGFERVRQGPLRLLVKAEAREAILGLYKTGNLLVPGRRPDEKRLGGRQGAFSLPLDWPGAGEGSRVVVRRFVHGGLVGKLRGGLYFTARSFRELRLLAAAGQAGLPVPRPLAAVRRPVVPGLVWREELITREEPGARPLTELLAEWAGEEDGARRDNVLEAVAQAVRALHDRGFCHPDLNVANLLIAKHEERRPRVVVIDFDRAWRAPSKLEPARRLAALVRLYRSVQKRHRGLLAPEERLRFFLFYAGEDGELQALREELIRRCHRALRIRRRT